MAAVAAVIWWVVLARSEDIPAAGGDPGPSAGPAATDPASATVGTAPEATPVGPEPRTAPSPESVPATFTGVQHVPLDREGTPAVIQLAWKTHPRPGHLLSVVGGAEQRSTREWEALGRVAMRRVLDRRPDVPPGVRLQLRVFDFTPRAGDLLALTVAMELALQGRGYPPGQLLHGVLAPGGLIVQPYERAAPEGYRRIRAGHADEALVALGGQAVARLPVDDTANDAVDEPLPVDRHAIDGAAAAEGIRYVLAQRANGRATAPPEPESATKGVRRLPSLLRTLSAATLDSWLSAVVAAGAMTAAVDYARFSNARLPELIERTIRKGETPSWQLQLISSLVTGVTQLAPALGGWTAVLAEARGTGFAVSGELLRSEVATLETLQQDLRLLIELAAPAERQRPRPYPHDLPAMYVLDQMTLERSPDAGWGRAVLRTAQLEAFVVLASLFEPRANLTRLEPGHPYQLPESPETTALADALCERLKTEGLTEVRRLARCGEESGPVLERLTHRLEAAVVQREVRRVRP